MPDLDPTITTDQDASGTPPPGDARQWLDHALPGLRALEGFPEGPEPCILHGSLPPSLTACPNPFVRGFAEASSITEPGPEHPLAADIHQGRSDPVYGSFIYHTKVPPRAIARYIEHYCPPGGLVLDGFCGSGMTGVAARMTGRRALLVDLSPAATAIAAAYCLPVDLAQAEAAADLLMARLEDEFASLYRQGDGPETDYVIWSEVYACGQCGHQAPFAEFGFDFDTQRPRARTTCPGCGHDGHPRELSRVLDGHGRTLEAAVRISHLDEPGDRPLSPAETADLERIIAQPATDPHPEGWMMGREPSDAGWGDMWRRGYHTGILRPADFYFPRALRVIAGALRITDQLPIAQDVRHLLRTTIINGSVQLTRMRRAYQGPVPLVLYLPRLRREANAVRVIARRLQIALRGLRELPATSQVLISTQSSAALPNVPDECADYVFVDPPFGQNIIYSEVNHLWEAWLGVATAQAQEAIMSRRQRKGVAEYGDLMRRCFAEFHRILKPGAWLTVEFHNSRNDVWTAIQEALSDAGFTALDVRVLDKGQQSFKQASTDNAVEKDLVISARKPASVQTRRGPRRPPLTGGDVWQWVQQRLAETEAGEPERATRALYARMVQHWLASGWRIPLDAGDFYAGLAARYRVASDLVWLPAEGAPARP